MSPSLEVDLEAAMDAVVDRVGSVVDETGEAFPYVTTPAGEWETTADGNWCPGHWIGLLRLAHDRTGEERFAAAARAHTETIRETMPRGSMFCGMNFQYAGFRGYDHTGDRELFGLGLAGADAMAAFYDERARQIPLGTLDVRGPEQFRGPESDEGPSGDRLGAVDNVYTALPVLWRAYRETGNARFRDVAVSHADRHLDWYLRADGSTWHHAVFDPETGALQRQYNELAYSDATCWARGQGWCIAGLARTYRETGAERYLDGLEQAVGYYRRQSPADEVPRWDFEAPADAPAYRDTSAAALAAYGLGRLPADTPHPDRTADLRAYGFDVLESLLERYLVTEASAPNYGAVEHGCFNGPAGYAADSELIWTNYYVARTVFDLLEAA